MHKFENFIIFWAVGLPSGAENVGYGSGSRQTLCSQYVYAQFPAYDGSYAPIKLWTSLQAGWL
jgi:hypothetical protein